MTTQEARDAERDAVIDFLLDMEKRFEAAGTQATALGIVVGFVRNNEHRKAKP